MCECPEPRKIVEERNTIRYINMPTGELKPPMYRESHTKTVDRRIYHWSNKCGNWVLTHTTKWHGKEKEEKKTEIKFLTWNELDFNWSWYLVDSSWQKTIFTYLHQSFYALISCIDDENFNGPNTWKNQIDNKVFFHTHYHQHTIYFRNGYNCSNCSRTLCCIRIRYLH